MLGALLYLTAAVWLVATVLEPGCGGLFVSIYLFVVYIISSIANAVVGTILV